MKKEEIKLCVVNSASMTATMCQCIGNGDYNPARAHFHNVIKIAHYLGLDTIYDVGEHTDHTPLDDVMYHCQSTQIDIKQINLQQLSNLDGIRIAIFLYCYIDSPEKVNYFRSISNFVDKIIYYASDDELYYKDYLLELWGKSKSFFMNLDKLMMILSGHCYSVDYPKLTKNVHHLPMYPNNFIKKFYESLQTYPTLPTFDFFLNCHHHTKVATDFINKMPNRSFLIFTNSAVYDYFDESIKHNGKVQFIKSLKANTELTSILQHVTMCKYYLIPNTYYHTDIWYETGHYVQSVMYTHKVIEAYYANRMVLGDLTDENLMHLNAQKDLQFISRSEFYGQVLGISDPMDELIESTEEKCREIAAEILLLLKTSNI